MKKKKFFFQVIQIYEEKKRSKFVSIQVAGEKQKYK